MTEKTQEEYVQAVYGHAAGLMRDGLSDEDVEKKLVEQGLDAASAQAVVANLREIRSKQKRAQGQKNMGFGALWCIGGIVVTAATYGSASGGGTYVVAWGAILVGVVQFLQGLYQVSTAGA
jgi:hypothetical protein